jgi:hypothetical protein
MKSPCARFLPRKEIRQMQGDSANPLAIFVHIATGCDFQFEKRKHKPSLRICSATFHYCLKVRRVTEMNFATPGRRRSIQGRSYAI